MIEVNAMRPIDGAMWRNLSLSRWRVAVMMLLGVLVPAITVFADGGSMLDWLEFGGSPRIVAPWARQTYGSNYCGYYVGGGAVLPVGRSWFTGEPPYSHEGTFGMDYDPWWSRVRLQWYHGTRSQGGEGQYEPDRLNFPIGHFFRR